MYNGILPVYKEKGYTSFDVVACLRKILGQKKIGHTGTLDPDACGVLPVCLGNATKIAEKLTSSGKQYRAKMLLGKKTDTLDVSGKILCEKKPVKDINRIEAVLLSFKGSCTQIPPMYSALKVNGKKLCDLARQGIEVERKPRIVEIYGIDILGFTGDTVEFTVDCSKGTYIRTLIDDAGEALGCGACMSELTRTGSGGFSLDQCLRLDDIQKAADEGSLNDIIIGTEEVFSEFPKLRLTKEFDRLLYNGNALLKHMFDPDVTETAEMYRVYDSEGVFWAVYMPVDDRFKIKYFFGSN